MFFFPTSAALNHLLAQNSWAVKRLVQFSGKTVRFDITPLSLAYTILPDGFLVISDSSTAADTVCNIAPSLIPRLALHDQAAFSEIRHEGDSALFTEIVSLMRELRWDMAEDLSRFTGDIAAERITHAVQGTRRQLRDALSNFSEAAAEYWIEERPLVVKPQQISEFGMRVASLSGKVEQLEQRIDLLFSDGAKP